MKEAVVFGLFETGLGVIRSLGNEKIKVTGIDFKKDIGWYSKFVEPKICPHPLKQEDEFIDWLNFTFAGSQKKLPIYFASDDFLVCFSRHRKEFEKYFLFNIPGEELLFKLQDKNEQYHLVKNTGINIPETIVIKDNVEIDGISFMKLNFPVFVKGLEVNSWRENISGTTKGYEVHTKDELKTIVKEIVSKKTPVILQEIIKGEDTNHYKYCCYISKNGENLAEFTLQKIRQNPIHYGVGVLVESVSNEELILLGRKLFKEIGFTGIGSAEFKMDNRDSKFKLIEINPRYWQQNYLSTACGINFPLINFQDLTGEKVIKQTIFETGIKWVNRYSDLDSYLHYRKEGLSFRSWRKSLKGKKVFSEFTWNDPLPALSEIGFGWKLFRAPLFLLKRIFNFRTNGKK